MTALRIHNFHWYLQLCLSKLLWKNLPSLVSQETCIIHTQLKFINWMCIMLRWCFPQFALLSKKLHGSNSPLKRLSRKIFNLLRLKRNRRLRDPLMGAMRILPAEELWGNTRAFCVFCFPTQVGMHEMCKGIPNKLWSYSQTNLQTLPIWCIPAL